jgi:hypothetical protein
MREKKEVASLTSACCRHWNMLSNINRVPEKNTKEELMNAAPADSITACHSSGWIQTDIFTKWFDNFIHFIKPSADDPVLLIVDGHY